MILTATSTNFKLALKSGLYDLTHARDMYREAATNAGVGLHKGVLLRYFEVQALLLAPIAPHWAEHIWLEVLQKPASIHYARFPCVPSPSPELSAATTYVRTTSSNITSSEATLAKKLSKGKTSTFDPRKPKRITIYAAKKFPVWQEKYIDLVRDAFDALHVSIDDKDLNAKVGKLGEMKKAMPFVQTLKKRLVVGREQPDAVFQRKLPFDELLVLTEMVGNLKRITGAKEIDVVAVDEGGKTGDVVVTDGEGQGQKRDGLSAENAVPGQPTFQFVNVN